MLSEELQIRNIDNKLVHCQRGEKNHILEVEFLLPFKHPSNRVNWTTFSIDYLIEWFLWDKTEASSIQSKYSFVLHPTLLQSL